jgi:hypothetical protein
MKMGHMRNKLGQNQQGNEGFRLPELGMPDNFVDLPDNFVDLPNIIKSHIKQDSTWAEELAKVKNIEPGQV